jgi:hypothetical protein
VLKGSVNRLDSRPLHKRAWIMPDAQLSVRVAHARKTVAVEVALNGHPSHGIELTLDKLDKLISELGDARSQMVAELPRETFEREDVRISAVANTTWCIKASPPMGALLAFDHPKFGPVGFTLPRDQIAKIVSFLTHRFLLQPTASAEKH